MKETLEEAGVAYAKTVNQNHTSHMLGFHNGSKWQQERSYNEDDINIMFDTLKENSIDNKITITNVDLFISSWKKQFKNK